MHSSSSYLSFCKKSNFLENFQTKNQTYVFHSNVIINACPFSHTTNKLCNVKNLSILTVSKFQGCTRPVLWLPHFFAMLCVLLLLHCVWIMYIAFAAIFPLDYVPKKQKRILLSRLFKIYTTNSMSCHSLVLLLGLL